MNELLIVLIIGMMIIGWIILGLEIWLQVKNDLVLETWQSKVGFISITLLCGPILWITKMSNMSKISKKNKEKTNE